jgi:hypothetical protein
VRYADGTAFRRALADRLRRQYPDQDVGRLQKRVAMERSLARVVAALPEHARLKGGYALELRLERARATQDLDVALRDLPGARRCATRPSSTSATISGIGSRRRPEVHRNVPRTVASA